MDLFFNELSIKEAPDKHTAIQWMENLLILYKKTSEKGFNELKYFPEPERPLLRQPVRLSRVRCPPYESFALFF